MSKRLALGVYWRPRRESAEQCTDRLLTFMTGIQECDIGFIQWYHKGRSRKDALGHKIDVQSRDELMALLDKGRHRRDIGKAAIEELGFTIGMWNGGEPGREAGLLASIGQSVEVPGLSGNSVVLDFPEDLGDLADPGKASRVLSVAAACWEPDWAGISSSEARNARDWWQWPFVDWMVYVPQRIASVPPPSNVAHLENGGSVIVVQPNPPSVDNPEDQERIRRIEQIVRP